MTGAVRTAADRLFDAITGGTQDNPFAVLGPHRETQDGRPGLLVRTFQPAASQVELVLAERALPMTRVRREGIFEATVPQDVSAHELQYRLRIHEGERVRDIVDPYRYGQVISDFDLHLFA